MSGALADPSAIQWPQGVPPDEAQVLIAGGGPVGSALALDLARRGIDVVVVDRELTITLAGRARSVSARSMEHFRRWGVTTGLQEHTTIPKEWYRGFSYRVSLIGPEMLTRDPAPAERWRMLSPERPFRLPQYLTNAVLRHKGLEEGVTLACGWALESLVEGDRRVEASLVCPRTQEERTIVADYLVGCDGSSSSARRAAGIGQDSSPLLGKQYSVVVRLPGLFEQLGVEPHAFNWIFNEHVSDAFSPFDREHFSASIGEFPLDHTLTEEQIVREVAHRVGVEVEPEIVSIASWRVQKNIATSFRQGRVFVAGDAAHTFPPTLGQNMNTGISDAADLGWKLAAVLEGWGGDALLDSYDAERRPAAHRIADAALSAKAANNLARERLRATPPRRDDGPQAQAERRSLAEELLEITRYMSAEGVSMDQRYETSPICVYDRSDVPEWRPDRYDPVAAPGHRAPHFTLSGEVALYDLLGPWFTLLDLGGPPRDLTRTVAAARDAGVPLHVLRVDDPYARRLYGRNFALVRPDTYLAWRGDEAPDDAGSLFDHVRGDRHALLNPRSGDPTRASRG